MPTVNGFQLNIKTGVDDLIAQIDELQRDQVPFVTAYALTKTAGDIKDAEVAGMARAFDRPTRFTLNALYVKPATKHDLRAQVLFKDGFGSIPAWRFLGPQVEGGARASKSHEVRLQRAGVLKTGEYVVPGLAAPLDAYGNIPGPTIERILSQLQAAEQWSGYTANESARSRQRNRKRGAERYFVIRNRPPLKDGIYQQGRGRALKPVMMFVRQPGYRKRLDFYGIAQRVFDQQFFVRFREGWERYVTSRRA